MGRIREGWRESWRDREGQERARKGWKGPDNIREGQGRLLMMQEEQEGQGQQQQQEGQGQQRWAGSGGDAASVAGRVRAVAADGVNKQHSHVEGGNSSRVGDGNSPFS